MKFNYKKFKNSFRNLFGYLFYKYRFESNKNLGVSGLKDLLLVGTSLENQLETQQELIKKLKENKLFEQISSLLEKKFNIDLKGLKILDSFKFVGERENVENTYAKGAGLKISYNNNQVLLTAIFLENDEQLTLKELSAFIVHTAEEKKLFTKFIAENGKVNEVFTKEFDDKLALEHEDNISKNQFPVNESFFETEKEGTVSPLGFTSGCLWGGYLWCGKDCSNYKDRGGDGTALNTTDVCCMVHDYCYRNGTKQSTCNANLCKCVANLHTTASALIRTWYC